MVSCCVSRCLAVWPLSTSSCHGITPRLSNFHHQLTAGFHWFMSRLPPAYIQGLFARLDYMIDIHAWHEFLRINASSCKLMRLEFYKTKVATFHEFLVLYFSHYTHTTAALAVAVVDRLFHQVFHPKKLRWHLTRRSWPNGKIWRPGTSLEPTANTMSFVLSDTPQQSLTRVPSHLGLLP